LKIEPAPEMAAVPAWEVRESTPEVAQVPLEDVSTAQSLATSFPLVETPAPNWWERREVSPEQEPAQETAEVLEFGQPASVESIEFSEPVPDEPAADVLAEVPFASYERVSEPVVDSSPEEDLSQAIVESRPGVPFAAVEDVSESVLESSLEEEPSEPIVESPEIDLDSPRVDAPPVPQHHGYVPVAPRPIDHGSRSRLVTLLCLAALLGLIVLLPARRARR
jgi:hypothetical protein